MKILLVNYFDIRGGAARAAYRLHQALLMSGVESRMLVAKKESDDAFVLNAGKGPSAIYHRLLPSIDNSFTNFLCRNRDKGITWSNNLLWNNLVKEINDFNADVVHLHWVGGGYLPLNHLKDIRAPIVWTLHDMWAFTGGCHYDKNCGFYQSHCGHCPILGSHKKRDLSHWLFNSKQRAVKDIEITIVALSHWLKDCVQSSVILGNKSIEYIPNSIDVNEFKPISKSTSRKLLGISQKAKIILFGSVKSTSDERKGYKYLCEALKYLPQSINGEPLQIVVFGASKPVEPEPYNLPTKYLGYLNDNLSLSLVYSASDVFVSPSTQDNLPNTIMESLACGTPCVAFNIGGMPDMIDHLNNGYLANPYDSNELANGIKWVLDDQLRWQGLSRRSRQKVEQEFTFEIQANRYINLYKEILGKNRKNDK